MTYKRRLEGEVPSPDTVTGQTPNFRRVVKEVAAASLSARQSGLVASDALNIVQPTEFACIVADPPWRFEKSPSEGAVVEQYPKSEYAQDSRQRMIYLRDRLADYEVHVARYYLKRGAYVAAAQRAKGCVDNFDGAPAMKDALKMMIEAYDRLNLKPLADKAREVYQLNYGGDIQQAQADVKRSWWKIW